MLYNRLFSVVKELNIEISFEVSILLIVNVIGLIMIKEVNFVKRSVIGVIMSSCMFLGVCFVKNILIFVSI